MPGQGVRARAVGPERSLARVCREAGATVRTNTVHRDMNLCVPTFDARAIEVLASRLSLHHGAQLAVGITLRSAFPNASHTDRAVKERKCHQLLVSERCRLVVVAMETGGRWSKAFSRLEWSRRASARLGARVPWRLAHGWRE